MTVKELIEELHKCPSDSIVICQSDPEGNGYSPLSCADSECIYLEEGREVYSTNWSASDADMETEEEWRQFKKDNRDCVTLAPKY